MLIIFQIQSLKMMTICLISEILYSSRNPLAQMEEERKEHEVKMKIMEQELEQVFEKKVEEKMQKLKDSEADVSIYKNSFILF